MQELNLPDHVIKAFEKRWARKLQQTSRTGEPLARRCGPGPTPTYRSSDDHAVRGRQPSPGVHHEPPAY
jgi:hypothetical protein